MSKQGSVGRHPKSDQQLWVEFTIRRATVLVRFRKVAVRPIADIFSASMKNATPPQSGHPMFFINVHLEFRRAPLRGGKHVVA
jgi:hypothetical protein